MPLARALLDTAERSRLLISNAPLRVVASSNIGTYLLQSTLASFHAAGPFSVDLWIGAILAVAERMTNGNADVALMEWWDDRSGFSAQTWRHEPLVVIAAPGHPWAGRGVIEASELESQKLLAGEAGTGTNDAAEKARLGRLSARLSAIGGFGSTEAVKRAVRAGRGLSLVLASAVADG